MNFNSIQRAAALALATAGVASAQNDECSTASVMPVNTPTVFDNTLASTSVEPWGCGFNVGFDLWYTYSNAAGAQVSVDTCGTSFDTVLEVFDGNCAGLNSVICNDDTCALQSTVNFVAAPGVTYYIRVGGYNSVSGIGTILLTESAPPPMQPPVGVVDTLPATWIDISGTGTPLSLTDDGEVDIPTTIGNALLPVGIARVGSNGGVRFMGTATELGFGNAAIPSTNAFNGEQALLPFWDDVNTVGGTIGEIYWQETMGRLVIQWQAVGFFGTANVGEIMTFQVQVPSSGPAFAQFLYQDIQGIRADGGGSATIGYQSGTGTNDAQWSFDTPGSVANGDVISIVPLGAVGVGSNYCTANANSTGNTGAIAGSGSSVIANNDLTLEVTNLPLNAFGFFLTSTTQAMTPNPGGSQGILCLGGLIGRYVGAGQIKNSGATGEFSLLLDLAQTPTPNGFVSVMVGETRNYQAWYRDAVGGVGTSNFTNGLSVTFQ